LVLNLKGVAVRMDAEGPKRLRLNAEGPATVTAGMISESANVDIMNPDHVLCHLDKGASLAMELTVNTGKGYVPASALRAEDSPIGLIPIDAIFSPVKQVAYKVENARVGQITDYDKLLLTIETDGSISPEDAVAYAAQDASRLEAVAIENSWLQAGFLISAARALGLDCGPMSGFDKAAIDDSFFSGSSWRADFLMNIGYGDAKQLHPRGHRLGFDEACLIA